MGPVDLTRIKPVSHGSIGVWRVGSGQEVFEIPRVGSGRFNAFSNLAGRVGSGQEVFKISRVRSGRVKTSQTFSRVGSGQVTRPDLTRPVRFDLTLEKP